MSAPTPSPSPTPDVAQTVLDGVWAGVTTIASQQPWLVVLLGLLVLTAMIRSARVAIHSGGPRDPIRCFPRSDKAVLLARAGHRCEHHGWIGGRCRSTARLEADHVHPWSRGGATHVSNGQILCKPHNRGKEAAIPWDRSLRRLAERRATYFPVGTDCAVVRKSRDVRIPR